MLKINDEDYFNEDDDFSEFNCIECGVNTLACNEYYMINDKLWKSITKPTKGKGMLCIGCVELRAGRQLTNSDFTKAPINTIYWNSKSDRLKARLMDKTLTYQ